MILSNEALTAHIITIAGTEPFLEKVARVLQEDDQTKQDKAVLQSLGTATAINGQVIEPVEWREALSISLCRGLGNPNQSHLCA